MPARARASGGLPASSTSWNRIFPDAAGKRPMITLSSGVLPTPLRPTRQTQPPAGTSRPTSPSAWLPPSNWFPCAAASIVVVGSLTEVDLHDARVALDLRHRAVGQHLAFVQDGHAARDAAHELHVVLDDDDG